MASVQPSHAALVGSPAFHFSPIRSAHTARPTASTAFNNVAMTICPSGRVKPVVLRPPTKRRMPSCSEPMEMQMRPKTSTGRAPQDDPCSACFQRAGSPKATSSPPPRKNHGSNRSDTLLMTATIAARLTRREELSFGLVGALANYGLPITLFASIELLRARRAKTTEPTDNSSLRVNRAAIVAVINSVSERFEPWFFLGGGLLVAFGLPARWKQALHGSSWGARPVLVLGLICISMGSLQ